MTTSVAMPAALQPTSLTLSVWYKATTIDSLGAEVLSGGNRYVLRLSSNAHIWINKQIGASTWPGLPGTVTNALDGNWHHLAALYFDGVVVATNTDTSPIY